MQIQDEGEIVHLGTNKYIPLVSCISNLFYMSWHCLLKSRSIVHGYLLSTYRSRCGIRILSAMVWSHGGADYTVSPFPSTNTGVVVRGFRSSSVPVTYKGYLVESRRPLWPSSGPHKLIALSLIQ